MHRSTLHRVSALALAVALVSTAACADAAPTRFKLSAPPPLVDLTPLNGQPYDPAAHRGQWVLVYAWATWCRPCTEGIEVIADYLKAHPDVIAVGLDVHEDQPAQVAQYLSRHAFSFPLAALPPAEENRFLHQVPGIPDTWVIAPDGRFVQAAMGELQPARLAALMQKAGYRPKP